MGMATKLDFQGISEAFAQFRRDFESQDDFADELLRADYIPNYIERYEARVEEVRDAIVARRPAGEASTRPQRVN